MFHRAPTFQPRPYDPDRADKQTDAQKAATNRNFGIFKLRGLWSQAGMLAEPYRTGVRAPIDADLIARGALPQAKHGVETSRKRIAKRRRQAAKAPPTEDDIPF